MMFCSGQPLEPTRVLTADSVTASITVKQIAMIHRPQRWNITSFVKRASSSCSSTHTPSPFVSKWDNSIKHFFLRNGCLWTTWGQKASPWSLKNVLGLNSCGSSPSVSFQTSRNWSTLPWKGSKKTFYSGNTSVDLSIHTSPALHSLTGALTLGCCRCFSFCSSILFSSFSLFSWSKLFRYSLLSCSFSIS